MATTNFKEKNAAGMFVNMAPFKINMDQTSDFKAFVKNDAKKLLQPKVLKGAAAVGGIALALLNMVNDKNDQADMESRVVDKVVERMSSNKEQ